MATLQSHRKYSKADLAVQVPTALVEHQTIEQTMERLPKGTRRLAAQLRTPINQDEIWEVLTDYNKLSDFIPNLASSKLIKRRNNKVELKQVGSQKLIGFNFTAQVHIELEENKNNGELRFHLVKGDFRRFEGAWKMQSISEYGTRLLYELTVQGCIGMPVGLIEQRLRDDLKANLLAVEKEVLRRQSLNTKNQDLSYKAHKE